MSDFEIKGAEAVIKVLGALEPAVGKKVLRSAMRTALKPALTYARSIAPRKTGLLAKAIKIKAGARTRKGTISLRIQIGPGDFKGETFYGAFQEFGFHIGSRKLAERRFVEGRHFMKKTYEEQRETIRDTATREILAGIESVVTELRGA